MQIPDIKKHLPITKVLSHYNIKIDKNHHIKCPFHQDDKPSCKIYPETGTFHCFGCGATGDQIEFIEKYEASTGSASGKHEALKKAAALVGEETNAKDVMGIASRGAAKGKAEDFAGLFARQRASLPRSPKALDYLKSRGLNPGMEIGYNSGQYWNKLKQCITFPLKDQAGNITSFYGRRIAESNGYNMEYGRHYYSENRKGLYPGYPSQATQTLIITEAIIDAASLIQIAELKYTSILSAYGTNGLSTEHKRAITAWRNPSEIIATEEKEIIIFFDGDQAGKEGALKYAEELAGQGVKISIVATPQDEDINSLWLNYGKESILQLIEERQPAGSTNHQPLSPSFSSTEYFSIEEKESHPSKALQTMQAQSPLNTEQPNKITYTTQTARYIVKGSLPKTFDRMTISLDVQHLETAIKYRTRLDLYEEKQVRKEAREAAEKLDLRSDLVENDLSQLTDLLEEYRESQLQQSTKDADSDKTLTLAQQARCKAFLQQPDLIQKLNQLIGQSGITGEDNNRLFLFVIATSHKMPDTLHALIQGSSGSGKTHLLSKIAELMPGERVRSEERRVG